MGEIEVDIFEQGIEAVLVIVVEKLAAEIALAGGEAVVGSVECGEVVAPV